MVSPKTQFTDWDTTASNNTEINNIGILGTNQVSNFDDALRTVMAQLASGVDPKTVFTSRTSAYTPVKADNNKFDRYTAAVTVPLTAAATLTANWHYTFWADGADIVIDPNGAETINGNATLTLKSGQSALVWCTGTAFIARVFDGTLSGIQNQGYLFGLTLSNNSGDATNDIDIAAGSAASDIAPFNVMTLASGITKRLDAAWAVGSGNGGWLDGASMPNGTGHFFLMQRSDTGVVDVGASASLSPTLPTNYDRKRRIGSVIRTAGALVGFIQDGDVFSLTAPASDIDVTNPGTSAVTRTLNAPTGIRVRCFGMIRLSTTTTSLAVTCFISDLAIPDVTPDFTSKFSAAVNSIATAGTYGASTPFSCFTNTSAQVRSRLNNSDANTILRLSAHGWLDARGRA